MAKIIRKIDLMHKVFGKTGGMHICKECSNFVQGQYHDRILRKCKVYGLTHSQASDWAKRYEACGMFNKEWKGHDIIELVKRGGVQPKDVIPLDGQIAFDNGERKDDEK